MKFVITGTPGELVSFCQHLHKGEELLELIISREHTDIFEEFDNLTYIDVFEDLSWQTLYLAHLIQVQSPDGQRSDEGPYLTPEQLWELGVDPAYASKRVGGARKVCRRHDVNDFIFIEIKYTKAGRKKRYFLSADAIPSLGQFLRKYKGLYVGWLEDEKLEYPGDIK